MNQKYDCPNCGGAVVFQSSIAVFAVCPFCQSMVVRHDVNVEAIGKTAALPPDLSPLRIGTRGVFDGLGFKLIGRIRRAYDEGSWNEWCALFGDGRFGWVAEAQGFFMVSFEIAPPPGFPSGKGGFSIGRAIEIENRTFEVTDCKENVCVGSEGELTLVAPPGRTATSIDLTGRDGSFACAEYSEDGTRLFVGRYARFDDLKFEDLRPVPGWSEEAIEPKHAQTTSLKCPNCGATVTLRAAGLTMSATCGSCGSLIDTATPDLKLIRRAHAQQRITPNIPIGRRGVLFGVNYEVIGFQHVKDQYSGWFEYLLFNPWQGFVWLVNFNGHWSFVRRLFERPEVHEGVFDKSAAHAKFNGLGYRIFDAAPVNTDYVVGEFYWKVSVGMPVQVTDYVHPPHILSRETYPKLNEETWSQGEYVEPKMIKQAFNLDQPLREPVGIYLNQPNKHAAKGKQLAWIVPLVLAALLTIQIVSASRAAHQQVLTSNLNFHAGTTNPVVVTEPFEITGGRQALEYDLSAPVDNNWLELDIDLVNADTHEVAAVCERDIEYYHGYDDGPWSEGKQSQEDLVPAVPPGKYYLAIEASADHAVTQMPYTITVVRDVVVWSNFWIAAGLLLVYPLYCWARAATFERARWLESDYSPFRSLTKSNDD